MQINKLEYSPNAHSQAHLQFAQANARPKIAKELNCLPTLFLPTLKTKLGQCKLENKVILMKGRERPAGNKVYKSLGSKWLIEHANN